MPNPAQVITYISEKAIDLGVNLKLRRLKKWDTLMKY